MKRKKTRFANGGDVIPGDGIQYFDEDELAAAYRRSLKDEIAAMQPEGPSSEGMPDSSQRRNLETGDIYSTENFEPKKAVRPAPKAPPIKDVPGSGRGTMAGRRAIDDIMRDAGGGGRGRSMGRTAADVDTFSPGKGGIPVDQSVKAPASTGESTSGMSDMDKLMAGIPAGMGATRFIQAASRGLANTLRGREAMRQAAQANAKQIGEGRKLLESPGRMKRRELAAERSGRAAQRNKEVARGIRQKADESGAIPLAKGGSASRRADGIAIRGKTRGKVY